MKIVIDLSPALEDQQVVQNGLRQHNDQHVPADGDSSFAVFLRGPDGTVAPKQKDGSAATTALTGTPSAFRRQYFTQCSYEIFGTLEAFPNGHTRFFMRKSLS
jgi:hypothetical protein